MEKYAHVGGHHFGYRGIIQHASTKKPQELLLSFSVLALGNVLSLSQILTEQAALTGCSCQTESVKTLPLSV